MGKNLIKFTLIFFGSVLSFCLFAQNTIMNFSSEQLRRSQISSLKSNAEGSPYVNENFMPLKIKGFDQIFSGRYNAYNGEMEIQLEENVIVLDIEKPYEVNFINSNIKYKIFSYTNSKGITKNRFLLLVNETPEHLLLKEETIKFEDASPAKNSYQAAKLASFKRESDIYYLKRNKVITYLPSRSKDLVKAFPQNAVDIKKFIKKNKLSTKNEADLIEIVNYIISL